MRGSNSILRFTEKKRILQDFIIFQFINGPLFPSGSGNDNLSWAYNLVVGQLLSMHETPDSLSIY